MQNLFLVLPMASLVLLTFVMLLLMLYFRIKAVRLKQISPRYFKLNKGDEIPDHIVAITQNYHNLLELPPLFYVVCILAMMLNSDTDYFLILAWCYVGLRCLHSLIHATYNHILHRLATFSLSFVVLILMWVKVVLISVGHS